MDTTTEIVVIPATIKPFDTKGLRREIVSFLTWRLAELSSTIEVLVALPRQSAYFNIKTEAPLPGLRSSENEFAIIMVELALNGDFEALLRYKDLFMLVSFGPELDRTHIQQGLVHRQVAPEDSVTLRKVKTALSGAE